MLDGLIELTINNWDKYNPRNDRANHSWFKFLNSFFSDPKIYILEPIQKLTLIFLFCEASKSGSGTVLIAEQRVCSDLGIHKEYLAKTLQTLENLGVIMTASSQPNAKRKRKLPQPNSSLQTDRTDITEQTDITTAGAMATNGKNLGVQIWDSYQEAYRNRYKTDPVRNSKTNSQCAQIGKRLGQNGVEVARFYLTSNDGWLLKNQHPLGSLLMNAEGYHTQWQNGSAITGAQVRTFEKQSGNIELLEKIRKGEV